MRNQQNLGASPPHMYGTTVGAEDCAGNDALSSSLWRINQCYSVLVFIRMMMMIVKIQRNKKILVTSMQ